MYFILKKESSHFFHLNGLKTVVSGHKLPDRGPGLLPVPGAIGPLEEAAASVCGVEMLSLGPRAQSRHPQGRRGWSLKAAGSRVTRGGKRVPRGQ